MKIRAAVLNAMGAPAPYAESKPLTIETIELDPPGRARCWSRSRRRGLPFRPLGDQRRPAAADADGAGARGGGRRRGARARASTTSRRATTSSWCSCRAAAIACRAPKDGRRCASRARPRTAPARCCRARGACTATAATSTTTSACSGFAEYATVSRRSLVKIDRELPLDEAALFGCAVLTGVGAVINTAQVPAGATVAVVGLGGVGLSSLLGAVPPGARQIVAVDLSDDKLGLARQLGATDTFNAGATRRRRRRSARPTSGGVEFAFEMAGSMRALELAYKITRRGGTTVTAGLPPPTPYPAAAAGQPGRRGADASRAATSAPACRRATSRATSSSTGAASCRSTG